MLKHNLFIASICCLIALGCGNNTNTATTKEAANKKEMNDAEVQQLAKEAYVHCFPIFENYKGIYFYGVEKRSPKYAPMNSITRETKLYTPNDKLVVSPNNDTYYSTGILDVGPQPVIIQVPESKERYYVIQLVDMVTNNFAYIGVNTTGRKGGRYAITGRGFSGELPQGVVQIKSPSRFIIFAGRTAVNAESPQDIAAARKLQDQFKVGGIGSFYPGYADVKTDSIAFIPPKESDNSNEQFFNRVNFLLQFTTLSKDDQAIVDKFKAIGIDAGKPYDFLLAHPTYTNALLKGIAEGKTIVDSLGAHIGKKVNGWNLAPLAKEYFGTNYNLRTGYARKAIYANTPTEAYYPSAGEDADGQPLHGNNNYTITFPAGKLPPCKFFWSITMYDNANQLLADNALRRYSIGDRTKGVKLNADKSLTIYIGNKRPSAGTSNWLPAPPTGFNVMMRVYGPKEEVLNGSWEPPYIKMEK